MLAVWEDLSVKYQRNYRKDGSYEYIEVSLIDQLICILIAVIFAIVNAVISHENIKH